MSQFKIGDMVTLKSGSPVLTVTEIGEDGTTSVAWIDGIKIEEAAFPEVCFTPFSPYVIQPGDTGSITSGPSMLGVRL